MKVKIIIEYDGTKFCGWQKQENQISVQETLELAIQKVFANSCEISLFGAGRTDTGVHALEQVAHFELEDPEIISKWQSNLRKLPLAINSYLRDLGVVVISAESTSDDFHARFSAKMRHYRYVILNRRITSPVLLSRVWHVREILDIEKMSDGAKFLIGKHNFNAFRSAQCSAKNPNRTISNISITKQNDFITFDISAKSFLHNQVRIIVGTLKEVGCGKRTPQNIKLLLEKGDRRLSGITAPPHGLYFFKVDY